LTILSHVHLHYSFHIYPYLHPPLSSLFYHFTPPPSYFYSSPYSSTFHFLYHYSLSATSSFPYNLFPPPPSTASTFFLCVLPSTSVFPYPFMFWQSKPCLRSFMGRGCKWWIGKNVQTKIMSPFNLRSMSACTLEKLGEIRDNLQYLLSVSEARMEPNSSTVNSADRYTETSLSSFYPVASSRSNSLSALRYRRQHNTKCKRHTHPHTHTHTHTHTLK
jgi:hypothetical protein